MVVFFVVLTALFLFSPFALLFLPQIVITPATTSAMMAIYPTPGRTTSHRLVSPKRSSDNLTVAFPRVEIPLMKTRRQKHVTGTRRNRRSVMRNAGRVSKKKNGME